MNEENFLKRLIKKLSSFRREQGSEPEAKQNEAVLRQLLHMIEGTDEVEIPCDQVFELLDQYVEIIARNQDAAELLPLVKKHLDRCKDCREEYEALVRIIQASSALSG